VIASSLKNVLTSSTDAEYGNYSGGLINVVTKSGGNAFHGSVFEFLRNTALDAKSYFSAERSVFQQNQYGGTPYTMSANLTVERQLGSNMLSASATSALSAAICSPFTM